jgi:hypothetical protein
MDAVPGGAQAAGRKRGREAAVAQRERRVGATLVGRADADGGADEGERAGAFGGEDLHHVAQVAFIGCTSITRRIFFHCPEQKGQPLASRRRARAA